MKYLAMKKTNYQLRLFLLACVAVLHAAASLTAHAEAPDDARALIEKVVIAMGTAQHLHELKDVEYVYIYRDGEDGKMDVSVERYMFDGEVSWGEYVLREKHVLPETKGRVAQGYNGSETWMTVDGASVTDAQGLKMADFLRKTNYYWFAMMFKLLDPGIHYSYEGTRLVEGTQYALVKMTFDQGVGDVSDTYLLYINPDTYLVDRFLFTVMDFGMTDPLLMEVSYEEVDGLKLPTYRRFTPADWQGQVKGGAWTEEISINVRFNNGISRAMFDSPKEID